MKGVLIILDGLGDLPNKQLDGKTPLEAAKTINLDKLAKKAKLGYMYSVGEKIIPESDTAILSILGNKAYKDTRGWLEAIGAGIRLVKGDLALRTNFATISKNRHVVDRRAGRTLTTKEASLLAKAINEKIKLPCKFVFKNTIQHRGVLVLRGKFSDNITNTDSAYHGKERAKLRPQFKFSQALDDEENSEYTAKLINDFIEQSNKILAKHPVNLFRVKKGLYPANIILTRDGGVSLPELKKYKKWLAIVNMPLEIGIAKESGMQVFSFKYPKMKNYDVYYNLYKSLFQFCKNAVKILKKNLKKYNYAYIHFKETDIPGHDNKPFEKIKMIEEIDKRFFGKIVKLLEKKKIKVLVTADHSTPCKIKAHSSQPVPVMLVDWLDDLVEEEKNELIRFNEKNCRKGKLGKIFGKELLKKSGFVSK